MTWFERLTGFREQSPAQVRANLLVDGDYLVSQVNCQRFAFGVLEIPSLGQLRKQIEHVPLGSGRMSVTEVVADVRMLHVDPTNAGAVFQVASQFNLLEMTSPTVTPEAGVGIYEHDHTQGPACAISCGAGTIYRNYFVPVGSQLGQSVDCQVDCAKDLGDLLGNVKQSLWHMENGYLLPTPAGLQKITDQITNGDEATRDALRSSLRIGLQWNAEITVSQTRHRVSQAYCSALPVGYGVQPQAQWTAFATLVLEAAYEATICAAILNHARTGIPTLYLTYLGGGVFGNRESWIIQAIERSLQRYRQYDLDVRIVSYGSRRPAVGALISRLAI